MILLSRDYKASILSISSFGRFQGHLQYFAKVSQKQVLLSLETIKI